MQMYEAFNVATNKPCILQTKHPYQTNGRNWTSSGLSKLTLGTLDDFTLIMSVNQQSGIVIMLIGFTVEAFNGVCDQSEMKLHL